MSKEKWKSIKGHKGFYEISNLGRVRSLEREYTDTLGRTYIVKGKILSLKPKKHGYVSVDLYQNSTYKTYYVHRLVALAFKRLVKGKDEVNHRNGVKSDNRSSNLHWCTRSENCIHALDTGLNSTRGVTCHNSKLTESQVLEICALLDSAGSHILKEISTRFKITEGHAGEIYKGKVWNWLTNRKGKFGNLTKKGSERHSARAVKNCRGEIFNSLLDACIKYNINSSSSISKSCRGKVKHSGKYEDGTPIKWEYYKNED